MLSEEAGTEILPGGWPYSPSPHPQIGPWTRTPRPYQKEALVATSTLNAL